MTLTGIRDYLAGLVPADVPVRVAPLLMVEGPARVVCVALTGGPGLVLDGAFDARSIQVAARGRGSGMPDDPGAADDALALIAAVDTGLLASCGARIGGAYVLKVERQGGAPSVMPPDAAGRYAAVCNYVITAESHI